MRIFVSYRRHDSQHTTYRIADRLRAAYGQDNVFIDIENLPIGADFRMAIKTEINRCDAVLVVIGPTWTHNHSGSTIEDATDWVHIEVGTALAAKVRTVPVLVEGATMPDAPSLPPDLQDLAYLNAATIGEGRDFHHHVDWLIEELGPKTHIAEVEQAETSSPQARDGPPIDLKPARSVPIRKQLAAPPIPTPARVPVPAARAAIVGVALLGGGAAYAIYGHSQAPAAKICVVGGLDPKGDNWLALRDTMTSPPATSKHLGPGTKLAVIGTTSGPWWRVKVLESGDEGWASSSFIRCG